MDLMECKISKAESETSIVESDKTSFKLDEPITTMLNMEPNNFNVNNDDSLSFVVLGKDSIDAAQASALMSYVDIRQKSTSIDYTSMVMSMSTDEMQKKLNDMLQENVKLKETLKQNTLTMKEKFNALASWQEEVMKIHKTHKKKFVETRELVNHFKKENADLKTKLSQLQQTDSMGFEAIGAISQSDIVIQNEVEQITPELVTAMSNIDLEECKHHISHKISEKHTEEVLQDTQEKLIMEKELETLKSLSCVDNPTSIKIVENQKSLEAKDEEIDHLKKFIALLEEKLQCALTPIKLDDISKSSFGVNRQKFMQNIKQYNDTLQQLTECYVQQIERFATIENGLKEITDTIMIFDDNNSKIQVHQYQEKLCNCCKLIADEQVKIISDRQTLIKSQNQFQKIFSDYNSILYELEIINNENEKLNVLKDNSARENLQKLEELEQIKHEKQLFEEEKRVLNKEKDNLEEEKKLFDNQKKSLDGEREWLHDEKELLVQEKISLNDEKMSLDHQSLLYEENEKALQKKNKLLQDRYDNLLSETNMLQQKIENKNFECKIVIDQLAQATEEINLLRSQLILYEEDFLSEKKLKEFLLEEKSKLDMELQKQVKYNNELQQNAIKQTTSSNVSSISEQKVEMRCPKCDELQEDLAALNKHIDNCLNE